MKSLFYICLAVTAVLSIGKEVFPEFFCLPYIQWPLLAFLAIASPYGFYRSIVLNNRFFAAGFLIPPVSSLLVTLLALYTLLYSELHIKDPKEDAYVLAQIVNQATEGTDPEQRQEAAQLIYSHYGIVVAFKSSSNEVELYKPTDSDLAEFEQNKLSTIEARNIDGKLDQTVNELLMTMVLYIASFFVVLAFSTVFSKNELTN